jgi:hypothetical protein
LNLKSLRLTYAVILAACLCLSGCEIIGECLIDNALTSQKHRDAEWKRKHQDPKIMNEEAEREVKADTNSDIQRQEQKDAVARKKQFDDSFEKQLQSAR